MFLETVRTEGLAAFSYVVGDAGQAAVIDPQRDCETYIDIAHRQGARISHVFETHRNEDFVIGSCDLAARTGAPIHHGRDPNFDFAYGESVSEGDEFTLGDVRLRVLETPGHTDQSISLALYDTAHSTEDPVGVFTGDALFIGDVGRTDFYPDRAQEVAGLLYDSIHRKLLPLGDQAVLYPAHGAGSICGSGMAARDFSTLGYERRHNPRLQMDRAAFVDFKVNENHYQPPYFQEMEKANTEGRRLPAWPFARPCNADSLAQAVAEGMVLLDVREPEAVCGAHIPGSLAIPLSMLPGFAGWFLPYGRPIGLILDSYEELDQSVRHLLRLGYERVVGFLDGGLHAWETSGRDYATLPAVHARELVRRVDAREPFTLLDVRSLDEWEQGRLPGATHIYVGEISQRIGEVPAQRPVVTFCSTGRRALIAASVLRRHGIDQVEVCLGSMTACRALGCPVET